MTATTIQRALIEERLRNHGVILCPNYTPRDWFECDLIEITKAGYFKEFEVKVTRSDFFADSKKSSPSGKRVAVKNKHRELAGRSKSGPGRFWFVTPEGLLGPSEIPPFAGWIEVRAVGTRGRLFEVRRKAAPKLHGEPFGQVRTDHLRSVFYWRFLRLFAKRWA